MKKSKLVLKDDPNEPAMSATVLTRAIADISLAMRRLTSSGLNRRAVVALVHDQSKISKRDIELVLNNLEDLAKDYTS